MPELIPQGGAREPPCATAVGNDVRDRLAAHGQSDTLACAQGVNHARSVVAKLPDTYMHVRQRSTARVASAGLASKERR